MTTRAACSRRLSGTCLLLAAAVTVAAAPPLEPRLLSRLVWRNIGPFRGGRIAAVTGAVGQPGVFYARLPPGGVWKTTSAAVTSRPFFDSLKDLPSIQTLE